MALPSFEKVLTRTDIHEMLVIPTHFMQHLPGVEGGQSVELTVNASGTQRTFGYYTRDGPNRRPVLRSGWRTFVRDKGLEIDHKILFECVDGFPQYQIRAQKKIILLGQETWADF
ncbi:hypothetical protein SLEP1_g52640 [Rubroshorea leprosula]|uniref:TF-B3 domain-containing protein n=1 Tax=Rubroshorea leprosula TaxID=152421 RepID=A0AAV5M6W8_9ROSI|nr:hypothetical protein SLEP1_g52640 [Rubroshorea leprosula]